MPYALLLFGDVFFSWPRVCLDFLLWVMVARNFVRSCGDATVVILDMVMTWRKSLTRLISLCCAGVYCVRASGFIMQWLYLPFWMISNLSVRDTVRLCWYRKCQSNVVQVLMKHEMWISGCLRSGAEMPDSSCIYFTHLSFNSFPVLLSE